MDGSKENDWGGESERDGELSYVSGWSFSSTEITHHFHYWRWIIIEQNDGATKWVCECNGEVIPSQFGVKFVWKFHFVPSFWNLL